MTNSTITPGNNQTKCAETFKNVYNSDYVYLNDESQYDKYQTFISQKQFEDLCQIYFGIVCGFMIILQIVTCALSMKNGGIVCHCWIFTVPQAYFCIIAGFFLSLQILWIHISYPYVNEVEKNHGLSVFANWYCWFLGPLCAFLACIH